MIDRIHLENGHGIRSICKVLWLPRSGYYHAATPTANELSERDIGERMERIFRRHHRRHGYRRIWRDLADDGVVCGPARVRRLMVERGLRAIQPRTYVPRTSDGKADKPSPNRLLAAGRPATPDTACAGDITFTRPPPAGFISPSSSTCVPVASSAGPSTTTSAPILPPKPFDRAMNHDVRSLDSSSTAIGAVNTAAGSSALNLRKQGRSKACRR